MGTISNKLKSNSGATLMMALLFFVVCAVTGSMILLSATAAAGRLKGMKTSDQNYYAVRSAAKMVEKQLQNEYIKAEEKLTKHVETETVKDSETGEESEKTTITYSYTPPVFKKVTVDGSGHKTTSGELSGGSGLIIDMLKSDKVSFYDDKLNYDGSDPEEYPKEFNYKWFKESEGGSIGHSDEQSTDITVKEGSNEIADLSVTMKAEMDSTGILTMTFINSDDATGDESDADSINKYSIVLKMQCNKEREYDEESNEDGDSVKKRIYELSFKTISLEKG